MEDPLLIGDKEFSSRLIMGTGGATSLQALESALVASGAEMATVASATDRPDSKGSIVDLLDRVGCELLPNTAGCFTPHDAVTTARLAREAFETNWIKLEVIGDDKTLLPDPIELLGRRGDVGRRQLHSSRVHERRPDPRPSAGGPRLRCGDATRLADRQRHGDQEPVQHHDDRRRANVPVVLDAGIGTASDAALAMELGCDAVLVASAVTRAEKPATMAEAMRKAVEAGRLAHGAGRIPRRLYARESTPSEGLPEL